jgi:hypothetical protein
MVFIRQPEKIEIDATATAINGALADDNVNHVFASCGNGGVHMVYGGVREVNGTVYADTSYGVQEVQSVTVLTNKTVVSH